METRNQKRIREILGEKDEAVDLSLQSKAYERAMSESVPTTMTPWEWEEWYALHGKPEAFKKATKD